MAKFLDLPAFSDSLHTWTVVPAFFVPVLAAAIPGLEVSLSLMWLLGLHRQAAGAIMLGFLVLVTGAYFAQWAISSQPACACFGVLARYLGEIESAKGVLIRNILLILGVSAGLWSGLPPRARHAPISEARAPARAFTLIETIVVVMLVALLMALLAPNLAQVREGGQATKTLANLRSHAATATAYAGDFKDLAPYATTPNAISIIRCFSRQIAVKANYFDMAYRWHIAMGDGYYNGDPYSKSFASPFNPLNSGGPGGGSLGTDYWYSCTFLASPEFYNEQSALGPPVQLRAVKISEVTFPSKKTIFAEFLRPDRLPRPVPQAGEGQRIPASFGDGHAQWGEVRTKLTHRTGDGNAARWTHGGHFPATPYLLLHTQDGVRGRDIE
jgi:type II secretory pathway pseudopilin PulG